MGKKSTNDEIDRRIHEVVRLLSLAAPSSAVVLHCAQEYGVGERQAKNYIARARAVIKADYSIERSDFMASRMALLDKIIQRSMDESQHSNAIGACKLQLMLTQILSGGS